MRADHGEMLAAAVPSAAEALAAPCSLHKPAAVQAYANGSANGGHAKDGLAGAEQAQQQEAAALQLQAMHVLALLLPAPLPQVQPQTPLLLLPWQAYDWSALKGAQCISPGRAGAAAEGSRPAAAGTALPQVPSVAQKGLNAGTAY